MHIIDAKALTMPCVCWPIDAETEHAWSALPCLKLVNLDLVSALKAPAVGLSFWTYIVISCLQILKHIQSGETCMPKQVLAGMSMHDMGCGWLAYHNDVVADDAVMACAGRHKPRAG